MNTKEFFNLFQPTSHLSQSQPNTFKAMQTALKIPFGRFTLTEPNTPSQSDTQSKQPTTTLITCGLYSFRKNRVHMIDTTFFLCAYSNVILKYEGKFCTVKIQLLFLFHNSYSPIRAGNHVNWMWFLFLNHLANCLMCAIGIRHYLIQWFPKVNLSHDSRKTKIIFIIWKLTQKNCQKSQIQLLKHFKKAIQHT